MLYRPLRLRLGSLPTSSDQLSSSLLTKQVRVIIVLISLLGTLHSLNLSLPEAFFPSGIMQYLHTGFNSLLVL